MGPLLPLDGVKGNSPGLFHALPQEDLAVCPVQIGNLDAWRPRVRPVQLVMNPVNGQTTCSNDTFQLQLHAHVLLKETMQNYIIQLIILYLISSYWAADDRKKMIYQKEPLQRNLT